jgi:hypothetical protein
VFKSLVFGFISAFLGGRTLCILVVHPAACLIADLWDKQIKPPEEYLTRYHSFIGGVKEKP